MKILGRLVVGISALIAEHQPSLADGVETLAPVGSIKSTGTWSLASRAGDYIFVAGMRGIDPKTNALVEGDEARIRQAFLNMQSVAQSGYSATIRMRR